MNPTTTKPRLTTRRVDDLNAFEAKLLRLADSYENGIIWLVHGKLPSDYFLAAYYLQRLGYFWPTYQGKPREESSGEYVSGSFGWQVTDEGRAALTVLNARVAA